MRQDTKQHYLQEINDILVIKHTKSYLTTSVKILTFSLKVMLIYKIFNMIILRNYAFSIRNNKLLKSTNLIQIL